MKIQTSFDGNDTYGFPLTFHVKWSGMCYDCPENPTEIYIGYLLIDFIISGMVAIGIFNLSNKYLFKIK